jgi:hypothetical protein
MRLNPSQCRTPAFIDFDQANRSVQCAASRAFASCAPGCADAADEINAGIGLVGQRDSDLTGPDRIIMGSLRPHIFEACSMPRPEARFPAYPARAPNCDTPPDAMAAHGNHLAQAAYTTRCFLRSRVACRYTAGGLSTDRSARDPHCYPKQLLAAPHQNGRVMACRGRCPRDQARNLVGRGHTRLLHLKDDVALLYPAVGG